MIKSGTDWTDTTLSDVSNILDIEALDANTAWAVGALWGGGGVILKTTDGGVTWEKQKTLTGTWPSQVLSSVSVVDATLTSYIFKTSDGAGAGVNAANYQNSARRFGSPRSGPALSFNRSALLSRAPYIL